MILDSQWMFTGGSGGVGNNDGATDSPTTGSQVSSNSVDIGIKGGLPASAAGAGGGRDLGIGDDPALKLLVIVNTALTGGTNIQVNLQGAPDAGNNTAGAFVVYASGPVVVEASLIVGARLLDIDFPRPSPGAVPPRFIQLGYVSTGTHGAGKIEGIVVLDRHDLPEQSNAVLGGYPAGINIAN